MNKKLLLNTAMTWGLILAVGFIVNHFAFQMMGDSLKKFQGYAHNLITILVLVFSAQYYKNKLQAEDLFSYGNAFQLGFFTFVCGGIIFSAFTLINVTTIDPEFLDRLLVESEETLLLMGFSDDMVEAQMEMQKNMMTPLMYTLSIFFSLLFSGTIFGLITSIFTRKKVTNRFQEAVSEVSDDDKGEDKWTYQ